jgi:isopentenyl diphosphate isomerase/L-lactate dehydrogenase-like FMN-dependent dehydrogenase
MAKPMTPSESRRLFLKFLAGSPALAALGGVPLFASAQSTKKYAGLGDGVISNPKDAINVFDFEAAAKAELPPAHWGYLATGTDDDVNVRANVDGFSKFQLRARRLVDIRNIDMSTSIFGESWPTPIGIAPTGRNGAFHPEAEVAVARAARAGDHLQILSTVASSAVEDVNAARGRPVWFQLYASYSWDITKAIVQRAERAGCPALAWTVDLLGGSNRETVKRFAKLDDRECSACHPAKSTDLNPMFDGLDVRDDGDYSESHTWDFVARLREITKMKLLVKGIVTAEDAALAVEHGLDGIIVSNHGGRAEASGRSTIECLPEIVDAVNGRIAVLVDGGFRRGTDFFKALALGADAVCIGRPYLWGLASFGQAGVEAVLSILRAELEMVMKQMGATTLAEVRRAKVIGPERSS